MKKKEEIENTEEYEEFDRKNLILLLELFILVFITVLFALAYKDNKDSNAKVIARGLNSSFNYQEASDTINYWLLNDFEHVESFDVVSLKEASDTCYDFIIKYTCEDNKNDCVLIKGINASSKSENKMILSGSLSYIDGIKELSSKECKK